ncbi:MAG: DUF2218 domain-containing protein [Beijerinckiaceae bacterium]
MPSSNARVTTQNASRYLQQVCKHWSHKFAVEFTPERGRVPFAEDRVCRFEAEPDALLIALEAPDDASLTRLEGVVVEHVKRFAFREDLGNVAWSRAA